MIYSVHQDDGHCKTHSNKRFTSCYGFEPMTRDDITTLSANRQKISKKKGTMKFCEGERENNAKTKTNLLSKKGL